MSYLLDMDWKAFRNRGAFFTVNFSIFRAKKCNISQLEGREIHRSYWVDKWIPPEVHAGWLVPQAMCQIGSWNPKGSWWTLKTYLSCHPSNWYNPTCKHFFPEVPILKYQLGVAAESMPSNNVHWIPCHHIRRPSMGSHDIRKSERVIFGGIAVVIILAAIIRVWHSCFFSPLGLFFKTRCLASSCFLYVLLFHMEFLGL